MNKINPLSRKTVTKLVCVDTLFRPNRESDPANFTFQLSEPINNVVSMKMSSLELPNNWYVFSSKNFSNCFTVNCYNVRDGIGGLYDELGKRDTSHNIVLPDGNYLSDTFLTTMSNIFNNTGNGLQYIGVNVNEFSANVEFYAGLPDTGLVYPLDPYYHDKDTGIAQFNDFWFEIDFRIPDRPYHPLYKTIGWAMGFRKFQYSVSYSETGYIRLTDVNPALYKTFLASESSFGSTFAHYIFMEVDDFQRNVTANTVISYNGNGDSYMNNNILAKVVISTGQFTNLVDNGSDNVYKERHYYGPVKLEKLHIRLLNRFGDVIDTNHNDFSFTLELEVIYS